MALLGDRCAEIVLGGFRPWESTSGGKGGVGAPEDDDDDTAAISFPAYPPKPRTMISKYAGACACGRSVAAGAEIVYADGGVEGCEGCKFGHGPVLDVTDDFRIRMEELHQALIGAIYERKKRDPSLKARHRAMLSQWIRLPGERQKQLIEVWNAHKAANNIK